MKVVTLPADLPAPTPDYRNYDREVEQKKEEDHMAALKARLVSIGYTGKWTGRIYRENVADGYALYMFADGEKAAKCVLVHLPYGDGYRSINAPHLSVSVIKARIEATEKFQALFAKGAK